MTLTEFLLACVREDEWRLRDGGRYLDTLVGSELRTRMLADVEAKRRIVTEHEIDSARRVDYIEVVVDGKRQPAWVGGGCFRCHGGDGADPVTGALGYCDTLRYLAVPYATHPDYDESWRP